MGIRAEHENSHPSSRANLGVGLLVWLALLCWSGVTLLKSPTSFQNDLRVEQSNAGDGTDGFCPDSARLSCRRTCVVVIAAGSRAVLSRFTTGLLRPLWRDAGQVASADGDVLDQTIRSSFDGT